MDAWAMKLLIGLGLFCIVVCAWIIVSYTIREDKPEVAVVYFLGLSLILFGRRRERMSDVGDDDREDAGGGAEE